MISSRLRLLVAEDHAFQRHTLLRLLRKLGAKDVLEATDGASALRLFRDAQPPVDVVVSDLDMPGMDGMEFLRHLGQSGRPAAVVLATAVDVAVHPSLKVMAQAYGVNLLGVLPKPITGEMLLAVLARHASPGVAPSAGAAGTGHAYPAEEIRRGLEQGEFAPFFQPKVRMADGTVAGFEALARWRRGDGSLAPPASFLGVMEEQGLLDQLTWQILDQSAAFGKSLLAHGIECCISVNFCASSLAASDLASRVTAAVLGAGLEPRHLILELTESAAVNTELAPVLENLTRLRLRGFGLSIDDYGTGYSTLQQLGRIPFTELKIDQSFVRNAGGDPASMILLESILDIARKLKLVTVAEGVESRQEWDMLQRLGCDLVQGYFVARPMPADMAAQWAADQGTGGAVPS